MLNAPIGDSVEALPDARAKRSDDLAFEKLCVFHKRIPAV